MPIIEPKTPSVVSPDLAEAARHVLGHERVKGGYSAGSFTTKLIDAAMHADQGNLTRLALGFPDLVLCVRLYKFTENGVAQLQELAR